MGEVRGAFNFSQVKCGSLWLTLSGPEAKPSSVSVPMEPDVPGMEHALTGDSPELAGRNWSDHRDAQYAYLGVNSRFKIQFQRGDAPIGSGLGRMEALSRQGLYDADIDSRAFARATVKALADFVSLHDLRQLVTEMTLELAREELARGKFTKEVLQRAGAQAKDIADRLTHAMPGGPDGNQARSVIPGLEMLVAKHPPQNFFGADASGAKDTTTDNLKDETDSNKKGSPR